MSDFIVTAYYLGGQRAQALGEIADIHADCAVNAEREAIIKMARMGLFFDPELWAFKAEQIKTRKYHHKKH